MKSISGWEFNSNGTNSIGFNGLPGGYTDGHSHGATNEGNWWSFTGCVDFAYSCCLSSSDNELLFKTMLPEYGYSVRCLRNRPLLTKFSKKEQDITIGTQTWTSKNLDVSTYRNGDTIPEVQDGKAWANLTTGAWCYYENKAENGTKYGKLYNWYAVKDPRGLAPKGYHIPKNAGDWITKSSVDKDGTKMKSTSGWDNDGNGIDTSGFEGLPGGYRSDGGYFYSFSAPGDCGYWWTASPLAPYYVSAEYFSLTSESDGVFKGTKNYQSGLSVRCIKD